MVFEYSFVHDFSLSLSLYIYIYIYIYKFIIYINIYIYICGHAFFVVWEGVTNPFPRRWSQKPSGGAHLINT